jgi:hypothetical protein
MKPTKRGLTYMTYPMSCKLEERVQQIVDCFAEIHSKIDSFDHTNQVSDTVLAELAPGLKKTGFEVEAGKKANQKLSVPVLFGLNGRVTKSFDVDAATPDKKVVLEVEAGRGVTNHQFLKDLFEACVMPQVEHLVIAVRNIYKDSDDFKKVCDFIEAIYSSERFTIPISTVTIIGY